MSVVSVVCVGCVGRPAPDVSREMVCVPLAGVTADCSGITWRRLIVSLSHHADQPVLKERLMWKMVRIFRGLWKHYVSDWSS